MNNPSDPSLLDSPIEYLKGVGPLKGDLLRKELDIHTFRDLLYDFPFRYIDRTVFHKISGLQNEGETVQLIGRFTDLETIGQPRRQRLVGSFDDGSGSVEIIWFQSVKWLKQSIIPGKAYILFGKTSRFKSRFNIVHPELEVITDENVKKRSGLDPVYGSTDKLSKKGLDARGRRKLMTVLIQQLRQSHLPENLPENLLGKLRFQSRFETFRNIHFPKSKVDLDRAIHRIKFEELFFMQLSMFASKVKKQKLIKGHVFEHVGTYFNRFFFDVLPFELTNAQKKVIKEIRRDLGSGRQMNRLLQGDVGSGKTIVALMCMLLAIDNGFQCCLMAPTEILAQQHYQTLLDYSQSLGLQIEFLSGSIKGKARKLILENLESGTTHIIVGTHAILEDHVQFNKLGFAITDEQHRFGVAQRAKLWKKGFEYPPHILVMTATPIPRTLAMTVYGDLEVSVIDELPPGRKPVKTMSRSEAARSDVIKFMRHQITLGRQIYIIFPLIEESEKLDLENLQEGYERLLQWFPQPEYQICVVHGRMKSNDKEFEMQRFLQKKAQLMVATTVIEVGVDIPNASVMVIENSERFGLSQLHQLRGRVGRGADQSYCILMTGLKVSKEARERINLMGRTNSGFEIAEADLKMRGPGELTGTKQSGILNFKLVNLVTDAPILQTARHIAAKMIQEDPDLSSPANARILQYLSTSKEFKNQWFRIS